jgi:hypothetical protein
VEHPVKSCHANLQLQGLGGSQNGFCYLFGCSHPMANRQGTIDRSRDGIIRATKLAQVCMCVLSKSLLTRFDLTFLPKPVKNRMHVATHIHLSQRCTAWYDDTTRSPISVSNRRADEN